MIIKKDIIYPIFLECCQYAEDAFWENIFENMAYGKPPYGTYISKDFLCCSYKKKEFNYKIEKKDAQTIYTEIYNILTKKLGLLSQRERIKKRKAFTELEETLKDSRKKWFDIKKKNIKELLIELYVTQMKNKHSLTIKQTKYLFSIIMIALTFKVITCDDIVYDNGHITSIDGIFLSRKQIIVGKKISNLEISLSTNTIQHKKLMSENWEKYLKDLRKMLKK